MEKTIRLMVFAVIIFCNTTTAIEIQTNIVGGSGATTGQFKYQVSLRAYGSHFCGGAIINNLWVVTAAHCVYEQLPVAVVTIVTGSLKINTGGDTYATIKLISHPNYSPQNYVNDIGLVKSFAPIVFKTNVQPIAMATSNPAVGTSAVVSGWGLTSYPGGLSTDLLYYNAQVIDIIQCSTIFSGTMPIYSSNICTFTKTYQGTCQGDSGGPIVASGKLAGVVSRGIPCGAGFPDVFEGVASYSVWIQNTMNSLI